MHEWGQEFWPSQIGLDCLTIPKVEPLTLWFFVGVSATPLIKQLCGLSWPEIEWLKDAWSLDQARKTTLTAWLHFDSNRGWNCIVHRSDHPLLLQMRWWSESWSAWLPLHVGTQRTPLHWCLRYWTHWGTSLQEVCVRVYAYVCVYIQYKSG